MMNHRVASALAAEGCGPKRLLVVDFLQLFRATVARMGYLTVSEFCVTNVACQ
jgi:hypothetical protein